MERQIEKISGSKLKLTFRLTPDETAVYEDQAVKALAARTNVAGFRPGKAPAAVVRAKLGDQAVADEAVEQAVRSLYPKLVRDEKLEVVGQPQLTVVSSQPLVFTLTVERLPEVHLGKWNKVKVKRKPVAVQPGEVEDLLKELRNSRASEAAVSRPAQLGDRVEVDFEVSVDNVIIDGGKGARYPLVLGQGRMIPGFEHNLVGLKAEEEKKFDVTFPPDYTKHLAGKKAIVRAKLGQVFERTLPELNDEFAKALGQFASVQELQDKLRENLKAEYTHKEDDRVEQELWEALLVAASFDELPEVLVANELDRMVQELSSSIAERGLQWADYLQSIKRDEATMRKEFAPQAEKRVKLALLARAFAQESRLQADEMDIDKEIAHTLEHYSGDERVAAQLQTQDYRDYLRTMLTNRRVLEWLKQQLVEGE